VKVPPNKGKQCFLWCFFDSPYIEMYLMHYFGYMGAIIKLKKTVSLNLDVVFFLQLVLGELEWKIFKIKENSVFHGASFNCHRLKRIL